MSNTIRICLDGPKGPYAEYSRVDVSENFGATVLEMCPEGLIPSWDDETLTGLPDEDPRKNRYRTPLVTAPHDPQPLTVGALKKQLIGYLDDTEVKVSQWPRGAPETPVLRNIAHVSQKQHRPMDHEKPFVLVLWPE